MTELVLNLLNQYNQVLVFDIIATTDFINMLENPEISCVSRWGGLLHAPLLDSQRQHNMRQCIKLHFLTKALVMNIILFQIK